MATTKTISPLSIALSGVALGAALSGGGLYLLDPDTDEMRPVQAEVSLPALVAAIDDAECLSELNKAPSLDCTEGSTTGGDGRPLDGWWCGGAFMPATGTKGAGMVGACLSKAKGVALAREKVPEAVELPAEVGP